MKLLRDHGLAVSMFAIFAATLIGLAFVGWSTYNQEQLDHGAAAIGLLAYLGTPNFGEAVFENWESEFLQMGAYVLLTALLVSRGSAESKDPDAGERPGDDPTKIDRRRRGVPGPVRRGGLGLALYQHSLTIALFAIFALSFALHAVTGAGEYSADQLAHGGAAVSPLQYLATSQFWFESLQNWQSEFLAVGALIVLSIFLRQRGSPESKPVGAPHAQTGD
ncbi:MAG: DUF6766 family protein [Chloroflexota bacterium]